MITRRVTVYRDTIVEIPHLSAVDARAAVAEWVQGKREPGPDWIVDEQPPRLGPVVTGYDVSSEVTS